MKTLYLIIAILTIVILVAIFFITYVLNKKTPIPEGCEKVANENCRGCLNKHCEYYQKEEK